MKKFPLSIISAVGQVYDGEASSIIASGLSGSFGVLASHIPMIAALKPGPLTVKNDGGETYYSLSSGVLEIDNNSRVLILVDVAKKAVNYDQAKAPIQQVQEARSIS